MTEEVKVMEDTIVKEANALVDMARKVFLAGIGAVVVAQESVTEFMSDTKTPVNKFVEDVEVFVNKLVERGEIAEKEGRQLIDELLEKRKNTAEKMAESAKSALNGNENGIVGHVDELVNRLNLPTKDDFDALTKRISQLGRKVDQLQDEAVDNASQVAEDASDAAEDVAVVVDEAVEDVVDSAETAVKDTKEAVADA